MALMSNVINKGTHAARPAAGSAGVLYYETDTYTLFRDNGTIWDEIAAPTTPPAAGAYHNANQSIPSATWTAVALNSTRFDQGTSAAQHSASVNNSRLTCQSAGLYLIVGQFEFDTAGGAQRGGHLLLNSTINIGEVYDGGLATSGTPYCGRTLLSLYPLSVNDYVELFVYQNSGGNLTLFGAGNFSPELHWCRVG